MPQFLKIFLPTFFIIYILTAFLLRSIIVWKKTGINPYRFNNEDNLYNFVGRLFRLSFLLFGAVIIFYSIAPKAWYAYLQPFKWMESSIIQIIGISLSILSWIIIMIAQSSMGTSWRIGIDKDHSTNLVEKGIFRYSRNPIFLSLMMALIGAFLIIPNTATILNLVTAWILISVQIRLEETHLLAQHDESYKAYCNRVRRWL